MTHDEWIASLPKVHIELSPVSYLNRIFVDDQEWSGVVKRISVDVERKETLVTLTFYGKVTAEGPLNLQPWPIHVENEGRVA